MFANYNNQNSKLHFHEKQQTFSIQIFITYTLN